MAMLNNQMVLQVLTGVLLSCWATVFLLPWCKPTNINVEKPMEKPWFLCEKMK